jgi:hypothetical protein
VDYGHSTYLTQLEKKNPGAYIPNTGLKFEAVLANSLISFGFLKIFRMEGPSVPGLFNFSK